MEGAAVKDMEGFCAYGQPGQGQYSKDNLSSQRLAEVAAAYVMKALGENTRDGKTWYLNDLLVQYNHMDAILHLVCFVVVYQQSSESPCDAHIHIL